MGAVRVIVPALTVLMLGYPVVRAAAATPPNFSAVPAQWIAKQYTELLGRAPSPSEWNAVTAWYESRPQGCGAADLGTLDIQGIPGGAPLLTSSEFLGDYPDDTELGRAARVVALVRAVFNQDPDTAQAYWESYLLPYITGGGTQTWEQVVSAVFADSVFTALVPDICNPAQAGYGFSYPAGGPPDLNELIGGVSDTQSTLQAALNAAPWGSTVYMQPGEVVPISGAPLVVPAGVTLSTTGMPPPQQYALMGRLVPGGAVCLENPCYGSGIVVLQPGAAITGVWVDGEAAWPAPAGLGTALGQDRLANIETTGSSADAPTRVSGNRVSSPAPDGVGIRAEGAAIGDACTNGGDSFGNETITGNLVTAYLSQRFTSKLGLPEWVNGISIFCETTTVTNNQVVDVTNRGITIYGSYTGTPYSRLGRRYGIVTTQQSQVTSNVVISAGLNAQAALAADPAGICHADLGAGIVGCLDAPPPGAEESERSFAGALIGDNVFWTGPRTHFDVGLMIGADLWWGNNRVVADVLSGGGISVTGNTTGGVNTTDRNGDGANVNMGIAVNGMYDVTLEGNTVQYGLIRSVPGLCPLVAVGVGTQYASVLPGGQSYEPNDPPPDDPGDTAEGCLAGPRSAVNPEAIAVSADGNGFVGADSGRPFVPWGFNYDQRIADWWNDPPGWNPPTGWNRLVEAFRDMRRMGGNTVRVLIEFDDYVGPPSPGHPNGTPIPAALRKLSNMVQLAAQSGIYLDITGLMIEESWDGPGWYDTLESTQARWAAQEVFWRSVARAVMRSGTPNAVAWYDLMSEPAIPLSRLPPGSNWCAGALAGYCYVQYLTKNPQGHTRRQIARAWTRKMVAAIRRYDPVHLISTGLIEPVSLDGTPAPCKSMLDVWGGAPLDFISIHIYPNPGQAPVWKWAKAADSCKLRGRPLVIEETMTLNAGEKPESQFILYTQYGGPYNGKVSGWLGFYGGNNGDGTQDQTPMQIIEKPNESIPDALQLAWFKLFMRDTAQIYPFETGVFQP